MRQIDYYLFGQSPYTYFGHRALKDMADGHGIPIRYKPIILMDLWANSGATPMPDQAEVRQRYERIEFRRCAHDRELAINIAPAHFPIDIALADRCAVAIQKAGGDPFTYLEAVGKGVWHDDADLSRPDEIRRRLEETGHDADAVLDHARRDEVQAIRQQNTNEAIAANAVGVPAYVWQGEVFFGQDRIDALDQAIRQGRAPFLAA